MKICQMHWDQLREKIDEAGLGKFGAKSGAEAIAIVNQQFDGDASAFDPLLNANFAIWRNSLDAFGLGMLAPDAPCPLCFLDECKKNGCGDPDCTKKHDGAAEWIGFAVRDQLEVAKEKGLFKEPLIN